MGLVPHQFEQADIRIKIEKMNSSECNTIAINNSGHAQGC